MQKALFLFFILLAINLSSQTTSNIDSKAITQLLYQHANDDTPGIAVGIIKDGAIVYEHYLGYANLEYQLKIDQNTRINIASNAKQFTALCILKLVEEGKVKLEDDIRQYIPDLYKNIEDKITISNLITHTSGIREYGDLYALQGKTWWQLYREDNSDALAMLQNQKDLNFKPGTEYMYSNSNYTLLTEVVKKVTGQKFGAFAKAMFEDLDMPNSAFLTKAGTIIPNRARPYGNWGGWQEEPTLTGFHGDGALFTTLRDQLKWEQIVLANDGKYLSKKLINKSQTSIANSFTQTYGYGLELRSEEGQDYVYHNGATGAYKATFLRFPAQNMSIVVMSNNRSVPANYLGWQIANLILNMEEEKNDMVYPDNPDKTEALKNIQDVLGIYKHEDGTTIRITERAGTLYREMYRRDPEKLLHEKGGLFEYAHEKFGGLKMNFTNIGQTNQQFTLYRSSQKPATYHKVCNLDMNNFDKNGLNGSYYNDETDTEIIIEHVEGYTYSLTKNGRERQAELVLEDYLRMLDSYEIKTIRDEENNVVGLNLKNGRIKNVIFSKH